MVYDEEMILSLEFLSNFDLQISRMLGSQSFKVLQTIFKIMHNESAKRQKMDKDLRVQCGLLAHGIQNFRVQESQQQVYDDFLIEVGEYCDRVVKYSQSEDYIEHCTIPVLQVFYISMQTSEKFWGLVSSEKLSVLIDCFSNTSANLGILLIEIGCLHIELLNEINSKQDTSMLLERLWDFDLPNNHKNIVLLQNLSAVCYNSDEKKVESFLQSWVKEILKVGHERFEFVFQAEFYENLKVRDVFLKVMVQRLGSAIKKYVPGLGGFLGKFYKNRNQWKECFVERVKYEGEAIDQDQIDVISRFVGLIEQFPVTYFQRAEQEDLGWILYLIDKSISQTQNIEIKLRIRSLSLKFYQEKPDRLLTVMIINLALPS
jgi:hypothetical protein